MSLGALQQLASSPDARSGLELGAQVTGNESPFEIWHAIAEAQEALASEFVPQWAEQKATLERQVSAIEQEVTAVAADWTGEAAEAATAYLGKVVAELEQVATLNGSVGQILAAAVDVLQAAKRAAEDAERSFWVALIGIVLGFVAAILAVIWIPIAGQAAAAALIAAGIAAVAALIAALIGYLWQVKVNRDRRNEDLREQMAKLEDLTPGDPLSVVPDVSTPTLSPVTIRTTIPEPPPAPAFA